MIKTKFIIILFFAFSSLQLIAQKQVKLFLDTKQYYDPSAGNYVEFQLLFAGYTIQYQNVENGLQGDLAISLQISQNDSLLIKDVYRLITPLMKDSLIEDFYEIRRFALEPGVYQFMIEVADLNSEAEPVVGTLPIVVDDFSKEVKISDIQIAEYAIKGDGKSIFYKSGYDIYPRLNNYFTQDDENLPLYFEIYNSKLIDDEYFALKQTLINADSGDEVIEHTYTVKLIQDSVIPVIRQIDITTIPSGNYVVEYAVINRSNVKITETAYSFQLEKDDLKELSIENLIIDPAFQASITDDSVYFYLASLIPISRPGEVRNILDILKTKTMEEQRKYIQMYWINTSGVNAYDSWIKYKGQVLLVEQTFKTNFQKGYETDRGRVYLQYGSPTQIVQRETSSSEYPYEIWQYNKIGVFSNKRFIFYNPDLLGNNYRLLHSDMIGELKNNGWPQVLNSRNTTNGNVDDPNNEVQDQFGNSSRNTFRQF